MSAASLDELRAAFVEVLTAERRVRGREGRADCGLSVAQWRLLSRLLDTPEMTPGRLAEAADITAASATQTLAVVEKRGMIERRRHPQDRRSVVVALTETGRAAVTQRREAFRTLWAEALGDLSDAEIAGGLAVLERLPGFFGLVAARIADQEAAAA